MIRLLIGVFSILKLWALAVLIGLLVYYSKNPLLWIPVVDNDANILHSSSFRGVIGNFSVNNQETQASLEDLRRRLLSCSNGTCRQGPQTKVALVTYMRSGSTLTGDILSSRPDVFYVFEPIHHLAKVGNKLYDFLLSKKISASLKTVLMRKYMGHLFNCDFQNLDVATLTQYHMISSSKTKPYFNCLVTNPGIFGLIQCLPSLIQTCNSAKVIIAKTISLPMQAAQTVFNNDPEVKLIHLVRDPRATIFSHGRFGLYKRNEFNDYVKSFCQKLTLDVLTVKAMKRLNPGRVKLVLYEQLAQQPLEISAMLYRFIGMEMTSDIRRRVRNITMSGFEGKGSMAVSKANSSSTSQLWRLSMPYAAAQFVDKSCVRVYRYLGFKPIQREEDLTDLSVSLFSSPTI